MPRDELLDFAAPASKLPSASYAFRGLTLLEHFACALVGIILCLPLLPAAWLQRFADDYKLRAAAAARDRKGASITALMVLQARAAMHAAGLRPDRGAVALHTVGPIATPALEFFFHVYMRICVWATYHAGLGPKGSIANVNHLKFQEILQARLNFFDKCIDATTQPGGQLVVMGAGYDTRALNNTCGYATVVYEVDKPETQAHKLRALSEAGLKTAVKALYVSVNFNEESPWDKLAKAGFDRTKPFVVTWEGVSYYLPEASVVAFLHSAAQAMEGNNYACLMFDYFFLDQMDEMQRWRGAYVKSLGEEWLTFLPRDFETFLHKHEINLRVYDAGCSTHAGFVALVAGT